MGQTRLILIGAGVLLSLGMGIRQSLGLFLTPVTRDLALVAGTAGPQAHWAIPQAQEAAGGSSEVDVFNPGAATETVTVHFRLPSGPLAPLTQKILPGTTWRLATSAQTRIPDKETYSTAVDAAGGSGVVVGRAVTLPASSPAPQAGMAVAVDGPNAGSEMGDLRRSTSARGSIVTTQKSPMPRWVCRHPALCTKCWTTGGHAAPAT